MTCKQGARHKLWEQMLQLLAYYLMLHMEGAEKHRIVPQAQPRGPRVLVACSVGQG